MRRLAVRLLWDENLADDVLQEAWITAIERPPSQPGALRAWLSTVVRSLCRRANRSLARRRRAESANGRDIEAPSAQEVEERLESQRRLLDAVLSLPEPYRSVVYLHFYEGLKLVEIARLQHTSDSTIRTQLSRGLERLRERLERSCGGRGGMRAILLALVLPAGLLSPAREAAAASASAASKPPRGPLTPPRASARVAGAAIGASLIGMLAVVWFSSGVAPAKEDSAQRDSAAAAVRAAVPPGASQVRKFPAPSSERVPVVHSSAPAPKPAGTEPVRVLVVDGTSGAPVQGAGVYRAPRTEPRSDLLGTTAADGEILVTDPAALRDPWIVLAEGFVEHREPAARRDAEGVVHVVELEPEFSAVVEVLDPGGSPARGVLVTVRASVRGVGAVEPATVVTDPQGEAQYTFRHPDTTIRISSPGHVGLSLPAVTPRMTVRLRPGLACEGEVLGPGGAPAPECRVRIESPSLRNPVTVTSDASGRFSLGTVDPDEEVALHLRAPGLPAYRFRGRPPRDGLWRLEIPAGFTLVGTVLDHAGKPVAGGHVFVLAPEDEGAGTPEGPAAEVRAAGLPPRQRPTRRLVTRARASIDANGRFELGPVAPSGSEDYFFVHHRDHGRHLERLDAIDAAAEITVRLDRGVEVTGSLTSPRGEPLAGVLLHFGEVWSNGVECVIGRTRTGAGGAFSFRGLPEGVGQPLAGVPEEDGDAVVRASVFVAAFAPDVLVDSDGGGGSEPVELLPGAFEISEALAGGRSLRLIGAARERLAKLSVTLRDAEGLPVRAWTRAVVLDPEGGVHEGVLGRNVQGARFFSDQTLEVERLRAAELVLVPEGHRWCTVAGLDLGEGAALDVELQPVSPSPWRLNLKRADGTAAGGWPVFVGLPFGAATQRAAVPIGTTDVDGVLAVATLPPGPHALGVPFAGEELRAEVLAPEEIAGRVAWSWVEVTDGGHEELAVPAR
jgi:RNA polymerase sigma-70 factor (ECF subfamily)